MSKRYFIAGNHVNDEKLPYGYVQEDRVYRFFCGADALTGSDKHAAIMFGDSITALSWPELLAKRCAEEQPDVSIIRRAVSGSRVLRQYEVPIYRAYGASGPVRFVQECTVAGADTVVILHGINDIIHPDGINPVRPMSDLPTKDELVDGFRQYIAWARELGLRVYLCTILPIEGWRTYRPFREELRCAVNDWIRTQHEADGFIDLDLAVRKEDNPSAMQARYDSGDHLHPSAEGNQAMCDCVYEALFQNKNGGQKL